MLAATALALVSSHSRSEVDVFPTNKKCKVAWLLKLSGSAPFCTRWSCIGGVPLPPSSWMTIRERQLCWLLQHSCLCPCMFQGLLSPGYCPLVAWLVSGAGNNVYCHLLDLVLPAAG